MRASTPADVCVVVFARAPIAGRAKTRLAPVLGTAGAAALQRRMIARTMAMAGAAELHGTTPHRFFRSLRVPFRLQRGDDLGERMYRSSARALRRHRAVILIGTDCPTLERRDLERAARLLCSHDVVLAPAEDGGYGLIGLRVAREEIFREIAWGTATVLQDTLTRIRKAGLSWRLMRTVWDVDRPEDLARLRSLRRRPR